MGSFGTTIPKGWTMAQFMASEFNTARYEFLATAVVRTGDSARYGGWPEVFYAAVRDSQSDEVTALVVPFVRGAKNWQGETTITYKPMDENMGPCEASCPARILDLLSPTTHPYAIEWRANCRAHAEKLATIKGLKAGDILSFEIPVQFSDDTQWKLFVVSDPKKHLVTVSGASHRRYRISEQCLLGRTWKLIPA